MVDRADSALPGGPPGMPMKLALVAIKKWPNGAKVRCRFLEGDRAVRVKVERLAHLWERYANVTFQFVTTGAAQVRIAFMTGQGSWSALGTDALVEAYFPRHEPTMNYGWLDARTSDREYERVVVHEFGHALGCIHEHQNPANSLKWNVNEVYRTFSGSPNFWSKADIDHNILRRYSKTQTQFSQFDPKSIMLYDFPGSLFTDGKGTRSNTTLSDQDKSFISAMYPKRAAPGSAKGKRGKTAGRKPAKRAAAGKKPKRRK